MAEKKAFPFQKIGFIFLIVLALSGVGGSIYLYRQWSDAKKILSNPTEAAKVEVKDLVARVSKLMMLPNEEPQLATILEEEKLKDQMFFTNAKNGDKVLIFMKAQKAVLYRPSTNVIVEVAPLSLGNDATASAQQVPTFRLAIRNGTDTTGVTKKIEEDLKAKAQNVTVVERDNAKVKTYQETMVYDVTGTQKEATAQLAQVVGVKVGSTLPAGEPKPDADFLIIVGADKK